MSALSLNDAKVAAMTAFRLGEEPYVHPNGFIQLQLGENRRLHVWPDGDDVPRQAVRTSVHDHSFDMRSTVLRGQIIQMMMNVELSPNLGEFTHEIYVAKKKVEGGVRETVLWPSGVKCELFDSEVHLVPKGASYLQPRYTFHDTRWEGLAATLMEKENNDESYEPRVLVPLGAEPDNTFVRAEASQKLLWDYVWRALV